MTEYIWRPPSLGSKLRESEWIGNYLNSLNRPCLIKIPYAGFMRELSRMDSRTRHLVDAADSDKLVRAFWMNLPVCNPSDAISLAKEIWNNHLQIYKRNGSPDHVLDAWNALRTKENGFLHVNEPDPTSVVAFALLIFCGANGGKRRRNPKTGEINISTAPKSNGVRNPKWVTSRLPTEEKLSKLKEWTVRHLINMWNDCGHVFSMSQREQEWIDAGRNVVFLIDPPYGSEKKNVYDGKWRSKDDDALAAHVTRMASNRRGIEVCAWLDHEQIGAIAKLRGDCEQDVANVESSIGVSIDYRGTKTVTRTSKGVTTYGRGSYRLVTSGLHKYMRKMEI